MAASRDQPQQPNSHTYSHEHDKPPADDTTPLLRRADADPDAVPSCAPPASAANMDTTAATMAPRSPLQIRRSRPAVRILTLVLLCVVSYTVWKFVIRMPPSPLDRLGAPRAVGLDGVPLGGGGRVVSELGEQVQRVVGEQDDAGGKIRLEAHIMSKCPDAKDCLRDMILPVMQKTVDKVNFTLSFIGTPTDNDGVDCRHGPSECMGNILELCAFELYPDPKISLGFTMCITRDYRHIPDRSLVEDCALEHAVDFEALDDCAARDHGAHGVSILRDSVQRTTDAGVTKSCTVRLDDEIYCVRDNGLWVDCPHGPAVNDLVIEIEKRWASRS